MELGDLIEKALTSFGVDSKLVTKWLGADCRCQERRDKINALSSWARGVLKGKLNDALAILQETLRNS